MANSSSTIDFFFISFPTPILDPNIDETGRQLYKSNNGPTECCYDYCKHDEGLCSSSCDTIFISNHTAITLNNTTNRTQLAFHQTPKLFVKLDDGTYVLNDYSQMPAERTMSCPALPNITQSTQQCSISQAQAASSATSLYSPRPSSSVTSLISVLMQQLITLLHRHSPLDRLVASLTSHWMILVWNLLSFNALRHVLLRLAAGL